MRVGSCFTVGSFTSCFQNARGRVGGKRGAVVSVDLPVAGRWYHRTVLFSPPLPEPDLLLSEHPALQYRSLGFSSAFDFFECY